MDIELAGNKAGRLFSKVLLLLNDLLCSSHDRGKPNVKGACLELDLVGLALVRRFQESLLFVYLH